MVNGKWLMGCGWKGRVFVFLSTNGENDFPQIFSDFAQIGTNGEFFK